MAIFDFSFPCPQLTAARQLIARRKNKYITSEERFRLPVRITSLSAELCQASVRRYGSLLLSIKLILGDL